MLYKVVISKSAEKTIYQLPQKVAEKIVSLIKELEKFPRPIGCKKLHALKNWYRIRYGNYRIVYSISDNILTVEIIRIAHRKDVYKNM